MPRKISRAAGEESENAGGFNEAAASMPRKMILAA